MRLVRIKTRDVFKQGVGSGWYPAMQGEVYVVVAERTNTDPSQTAVIFGMPQLTETPSGPWNLTSLTSNATPEAGGRHVTHR